MLFELLRIGLDGRSLSEIARRLVEEGLQKRFFKPMEAPLRPGNNS